MTHKAAATAAHATVVFQVLIAHRCSRGKMDGTSTTIAWFISKPPERRQRLTRAMKLTRGPTGIAGQRCAMTLQRLGFSALMLGAFAATAATAEPKHGNFGPETVQVGGVTREYRPVARQPVDLAKPAPLVIACHGMLIDSKDFTPIYTRLNDTADKHKFILVYPEAIGKSWGLVPDKVKSDLAFFDALLARLTADYKIDPDR